jgi:hypothetical protein
VAGAGHSRTPGGRRGNGETASIRPLHGFAPNALMLKINAFGTKAANE